MRRALKNAATTVAIATVASLALAGCTPEVPAVAEAPSPDQRAALVDSQAQRIIDATFDQLAAADDELDADLLGDRIGGQAEQVRAAEYLVAAAEDGPALSELPQNMQAVYVSGADTWPRTLVGVSEQPEDELTPVVMLWVQEDIDTPYQLRAWAHMVPGATLPAMPGPTNGASQVPLTEPTVEPSPRQALEDYLELLRQGADSPLNENFAPDTYRERLFAARDVLSEAASDAGGDYVDTIQSDLEGTYSMSTADGGALVFVPITVASSFSVDDATVSVPAADQPLVDGDLDDRVTHHYSDFVVIYVPGPGVDSRPSVVAAEHHLVSVGNS